LVYFKVQYIVLSLVKEGFAIPEIYRPTEEATILHTAILSFKIGPA
jgi:hypothetical protein